MTTHKLVGKRIRLLDMPGDPDGIRPGATGTVLAVKQFDDWMQVHVDWDAKRSLMLSVPPDIFVVIDGEGG